MRVWMDALTPKQVLFLSFLKKKLADKGHDVLLTCRNDKQVIELAKAVGENPIGVGVYGKSLSEKLVRDAERIIKLHEVIKKFKPEILVSYPNPTAARVAFGVKVKTVIYTDTPHAMHAHRLSIPLSDYVIHSKFISKRLIERYVLKMYTQVVSYYGVEELSWINCLSPDKKILEELGVREESYIVARPPEVYAAYYRSRKDPLLEFLIEFKKMYEDIDIVLLPRYDDDVNRYSALKCIIPPKTPLAYTLLYYSIAVFTGGGTLAREAALIGTPGVSLFPYKIELNDKLSELGLPLYRAVSVKEALEITEEIMRSPRKEFRERSRRILARMEHPIKPLERILNSLAGDN